MKCFVTGASGFVGANLVHELNRRGHSVRALLRPGADLQGLTGADYETTQGDITDSPERLAGAMQGCDWCFHVAASYALWMPDYAPMFTANVNGTQNVIRGAVRANCSRIVYTSTVGCIGLPEAGPGGIVIPTHERTPVSESQMTNPYKVSKWRAEVAALKLVESGAPVVIVNPSAPIGPRDVKPTPTGRIIVDFLNHSMPAYLDTGLNFVHVQDVAAGHILAAERGKIGERYILGNAEGNWTMKHALGILGEITDIKAPSWRVPYNVALGFAHLDEWVSRYTGKPPKAPISGVRMAKYKMWFDPSKAIRELGLPQTNPRIALTDAVQWFREHHYVKN